MKKIYLNIEIGTTIFLVYKAKRLHDKKDVVLKGIIERAVVYKDHVSYDFKPIKCVNDKSEDVKKYVSTLWFTNAQIDTGYKGHGLVYPVFTTKEKCLEWIKG